MHALSLKRGLWLAMADSMAQKGCSLSSRTVDFNICVKFRAPRPEFAALRVRHALVTLNVSATLGLVLCVYMAEATELTQLHDALRAGGRDWRNARLVDMGWGASFVEVPIKGAEAMAAMRRSETFVNELVVGGSNGGSAVNDGEKSEVVCSRSFATLLQLVNTLANNHRFAPRLAVWLGDMAERFSELAFLFTHQNEAAAKGELCTSHVDLPVLSLSTHCNDFDSARLRWDSLCVAELLLQSTAETGPAAGHRWVLIMSKGVYTDIYGPVSRRECETIAAAIPHTKVISGHDAKKTHLCWSIKWADMKEPTPLAASMRTQHVLGLMHASGWQLGVLPARAPHVAFVHSTADPL